MKKSCTEPACESSPLGDGLCKKHYEYRSRGEGLGPSIKPRVHKHKLTDINPDELTAVCAVCGPVGVNTNSKRKSYECKTAKKLAQADYIFRRKYGIGLAEREAMWQTQRGQCLICRKDIPLTETAIDHNHETGEIRGILCGPCNRGLGMFYDNVEFLESAIKYLRGMTPV